MTTRNPQQVNFTRKQLEDMRKLFPQRALPVNATEAEMRFYFGQQSVLDAIESRVQRD